MARLDVRIEIAIVSFVVAVMFIVVYFSLRLTRAFARMLLHGGPPPQRRDHPTVLELYLWAQGEIAWNPIYRYAQRGVLLLASISLVVGVASLLLYALR